VAESATGGGNVSKAVAALASLAQARAADRSSLYKY